MARSLAATPLDPPADPPDQPPPGPSRRPPDTGAVKALGHGGGVFWFLTPSGEVRGLTPSRLSKNEVLGLYEAESDAVFDLWPVHGRGGEGVVVGWNGGKAAKALLQAAALAGRFDPEFDLGAVGAWQVDEIADPDRLLCCYGAGIYLDGVDHLPGRHGARIYPHRRAEGRPGARPSSHLDGARLLALLRMWSWSDPHLEPLLLLGWIVAAQVPACLDWRPSVWLSGDRATGKSTLLRAVTALFGEGGVARTADATYAGLRGKLRGAAKPIVIDELEADGEADRALEIARLIRITATRDGGTVDRGTADGGATSQRLDTCFLVSSILRPPLRQADLDRLSLLELRAIAPGAGDERLVREMAAARDIGPLLRRRVIDDFGRYRRAIAAFHARLIGAGHTSRLADQVAALLAGAWFATHDGDPADAVVAEWCDLVPERRAEEVEAREHDLLLRYLLTTTHPGWRGGGQDLIGDLVAEARGPMPEDAPRRLRQIGLVLLDRAGDPAAGRAAEGGYLGIATAHRALDELFAGTGWAGRSGRTGAWVQALLRIEGARRADKVVKLAGIPSRLVMVPLAAIDPGEKGYEVTSAEALVTPGEGAETEEIRDF